MYGEKRKDDSKLTHDFRTNSEVSVKLFENGLKLHLCYTPKQLPDDEEMPTAPPPPPPQPKQLDDEGNEVIDFEKPPELTEFDDRKLKTPTACEIIFEEDAMHFLAYIYEFVLYRGSKILSFRPYILRFYGWFSFESFVHNKKDDGYYIMRMRKLVTTKKNIFPRKGAPAELDLFKLFLELKIAFTPRLGHIIKERRHREDAYNII